MRRSICCIYFYQPRQSLHTECDDIEIKNTVPGRCNTQGVLPSKSLLHGNWETGVRICHLVTYRECCTQLATISGNAMRHIRRRLSVNNFPVLTRTKASPNTEGKKKKSKPSTIMRKRDATSPNVTTYYLNWWSLLTWVDLFLHLQSWQKVPSVCNTLPLGCVTVLPQHFCAPSVERREGVVSFGHWMEDGLHGMNFIPVILRRLRNFLQRLQPSRTSNLPVLHIKQFSQQLLMQGC